MDTKSAFGVTLTPTSFAPLGMRAEPFRRRFPAKQPPPVVGGAALVTVAITGDEISFTGSESSSFGAQTEKRRPKM